MCRRGAAQSLSNVFASSWRVRNWAVAGAMTVAALGCVGPAKESEHLIQIVGYGAPTRDTRGGVVTFDTWRHSSFPVVPSGSAMIAGIEAFTVRCAPGLVCEQRGEATGQMLRVYVTGQSGDRAQLFVSKAGYETAMVESVLDGTGHTYAVILQRVVP